MPGVPNAQQLVRAASLEQSDFALHRRTVNVSGLAAVPQLRPGGFSVQVDWQLEETAVAQKPATPPLSTTVAQHVVPLPHSSEPVLPVQSSGCVDAEHVAAHVPVPDAPLAQQSSPEGH